jgi:lysophospholipid acyltransferase (LPLAT)-like uncharacterized protein
MLGTSWRIRVEGRADVPGERLYAGWHENLLLGAFLFRDRGLAIGVSRSRDGDRVSAVLDRLGYAKPARGSSSRGGAAVLRQLLRRLEQGEAVGIFTDGPRGPAGRSKLGIVSLARLSGVPITPIGVAARPGPRLSTWDRTRVPLPFARVVFQFGGPIPVARDTDEAGEERICCELDRELERLNRAAGITLDCAAGGGSSGRGRRGR